MITIPLICAIIAFFVVLVTTPLLIRYLKKIELVVKDMNKKDKPLIPISGGLSVMAGLFVGLMSFIFFRTFISTTSVGLILDNEALTNLFAAITSIIVIGFVGFIDDLIIKRSKESSSGLKQWQKPLLTLSAAVPLMVISAGETKLLIPFIGVINFGILYPLFIIPIGVVGAANMVNMLAGFNGVEAGMGIIYMGMLGLFAYVNKSYIAALLALITLASLLAFYYYNKYPARILPGDSLTYLLGAVLASIAIIGNIEKAVLIVSIPFFIEFILKARSRFKAKSYGSNDNGKIKSLHNKIYSIPHIFTISGKYTEKQITYFIILIELLFSSMIWVI